MNGLQQEIDLRLVGLKNSKQDEDSLWKDEPILEGIIGKQEEIDVVVCNPPFF